MAEKKNMTFDQALAELVPFMGLLVQVEVYDIAHGDFKHVAYFRGTLTEGMPWHANEAGEPGETIYLRLKTGDDTTAIINLNREDYRRGEAFEEHGQRAVALHGEGVELVVWEAEEQ